MKSWQPAPPSFAPTRSTVPDYPSPFVCMAHDGDRSWLVLRWLDQALHVSNFSTDEPLQQAAAWLGSFHRRTHHLAEVQPPWITDYAGSSITKLMDRAWPALERLARSHGELREALTPLRLAMAALARCHASLIHGDCYPANVLINGGEVVVIDWERAGLGPGEVDLAALTDGWPTTTVDACILRYLGKGDVDEACANAFGARLLAARAFLVLRWLGEEAPDVTRIPRNRLDQLVAGSRVSWSWPPEKMIRQVRTVRGIAND